MATLPIEATAERKNSFLHTISQSIKTEAAFRSQLLGFSLRMGLYNPLGLLGYEVGAFADKRIVRRTAFLVHQLNQIAADGSLEVWTRESLPDVARRTAVSIDRLLENRFFPPHRPAIQLLRDGHQVYDAITIPSSERSTQDKRLGHVRRTLGV